MMPTMPVLVVMTGIPPRGIGVRGMMPTIPVVVTIILPRRDRIIIASFEADSRIAARAGNQHAEAAEE